MRKRAATLEWNSRISISEKTRRKSTHIWPAPLTPTTLNSSLMPSPTLLSKIIWKYVSWDHNFSSINIFLMFSFILGLWTVLGRRHYKRTHFFKCLSIKLCCWCERYSRVEAQPTDSDFAFTIKDTFFYFWKRNETLSKKQLII